MFDVTSYEFDIAYTPIKNLWKKLRREGRYEDADTLRNWLMICQVPLEKWDYDKET